MREPKPRPARSAPKNRLLAALPGEEIEVLRPDLEDVSLGFNQHLYEAERPIERVFFLDRGVASLLNDVEGGTAVEVATVGPEGMVGLPVFLNGDLIAGRAVIQVPGEGTQIEAAAFRRALDRTPRLQQLLLRYTLALLNQLAQNSACNRAHALEQRLARWLLMTQDRVHSATFSLTQEVMAQMLGTSRPTVSIAASMLMKAGLISYVRGNITVTDRPGLEAAACECYHVIRRQFERVIGGDG